MKQLLLGKFTDFQEIVEPGQGLNVGPRMSGHKEQWGYTTQNRIPSAATGILSLTAGEGDNTQGNDELKQPI